MSKVAITIDSGLLKELDQLISQQVFPNRSRAVQVALEDKLSRLKRSRLATECAKLDPRNEATFAEEGIEVELERWPEY
ncbi:MAG: CopG family ribbon-helix-helix protein [Pirellulales bacterium]